MSVSRLVYGPTGLATLWHALVVPPLQRQQRTVVEPVGSQGINRRNGDGWEERGRWNTTSSSLSSSIQTFKRRFFFFSLSQHNHLFNIAGMNLKNSNDIEKNSTTRRAWTSVGGKESQVVTQSSRIKFSFIIEELTPGRFAFTQALGLDNRTPNQSWSKSLHSNLQGGSSPAMWLLSLFSLPQPLFFYCLKA